MAKKKNKSRWNAQTIGITIFGVMMAAVLVIPVVSGIFPDSNTPDSPSDDVDVTSDVPIIFPPPSTDVQIGGAVINKSGLFQVPLPIGWAIFQQRSGEVDGGTFSDANTYDAGRNRADIIMSNSARYTIAQAYVLIGTFYENTQSLSDNLFTDSYFQDEWSAEYEATIITNRTVGENLITIDFDLEDEKLHYFGRQISWQDQGHVWSLRFVVPGNNPQLLSNLQKVYLENFIIYGHNESTLFTDWQVFDDPTLKMFVKTPATWRRITGGEGRAASYADPADNTLLLATQHIPDVTVASIEDAQSWLTTYRPDASIFEGQILTQAFTDGYWFAYTFRTSDGDIVSAALALLPNPNGGVNVAEIRQEGTNSNLLSLEGETPSLARQILETFTVMAPDGYIYINQSGGESGSTPTAEATTPEATTASEEGTAEPTAE